MKKFSLVCFFLLFLSWEVYSAPRYALVVGNADYTGIQALKNPLNDAVDIAGVLKNLDFEVEVLLNADLRSMREAVRSLGNLLEQQEDSVGLFYYAGHGIQVEGENFLIPIDADIRQQQDVKYEALNAAYVLDYLNNRSSSFNIIILDACRDNPFSTFRSAGRGLAVVEAPRGSIVVYATGAGKVASDGDGRNSIFTEALLTHLPTGGIEVNEMVRRVMRQVSDRTEGFQVPAFYSNYFGTFRFTDQGRSRPVKILPEQPPAAQATGSAQPVASGLSGSESLPPAQNAPFIEGVWNNRHHFVGWTFEGMEYPAYRFWSDGKIFDTVTDTQNLPADLAADVEEYQLRKTRGRRNSIIGFTVGTVGGAIGITLANTTAKGDQQAYCAMSGILVMVTGNVWGILSAHKTKKEYYEVIRRYNEWAALVE